MLCRSASLASVTIASVDQPRLSMPRKPERSATRCFWLNRVGSLLQNTKAPDTAHSPGSAARSNTNVSDGSSRMVRGNFNMIGSSEFRPALDRIIPACRRQRIDKAVPLQRPGGGRRPDQEIAIAVDAAALLRRAPGKPLEVIPRNRLEAAFFPAVERAHEMTGETLDDRVVLDRRKTLTQQGHAGGGLHFVDMGHVRRTKHDP